MPTARLSEGTSYIVNKCGGGGPCTEFQSEQVLACLRESGTGVLYMGAGALYGGDPPREQTDR